MAKGNWAAFQHASKAFDYPGPKLEAAWAKLHAGDQEPFPDDARIAKLIKANPKLAKPGDAGRISEVLQNAWRAYHRGEFEAAHDLGESVGVLGAVVANKAQGIHAVYLVDDEKEKMKRFEKVAARAEEAIKALPNEANSHYFRAFALGRYSQLLSIAKALAQGIAGKVRDSLDKTLKLAPKHAEAHLAMGLYHAEIVAKVGAMIGGLTYGAKAATSEEHLKTAMKLTPDAPIVYVEHANALLLLHGESREDDAAVAYHKAAKCKPIDAMTCLDALFAKNQIE